MRKMLPVALTVTLMLQGCAAGVIAVGAGVATDSAMDNRTVGTQIDDQTVSLRVTHALGTHKKLWEDSNLSPVVLDGQVLMIGQTPTPQMRNQITEIVKNVDGVRKVLNEVRLGQPISVSTEARDTWITTKVKTRLYANKIPPGRIKVITENSEVFLVGVVTEKQANIAVNEARYVSGVSRVIKFFKIIKPSK
jgi:osmotically-inducible protein OsmY